MTLKSLEETALSMWQCEQIARETLAGEERLDEKPGSMSRLREMLGFVVQRMAAPIAEEVPPPETSKSKKAKRPAKKSRVGQRKPKRDPLT